MGEGMPQYAGLMSPKCIYPNPVHSNTTGHHDRLDGAVQRVLSAPKEEPKHAQA